MTLFIGVDGGGTSTRAVVIDDTGRELGRASCAGEVATSSNPELAAEAVTRAVRAAAAECGVDLPCAVLWAGLAGAGSSAARDGVRSALEREEIADRVVVGTDVEAAFRDAFPEGPGVLLIAGTGSIAWSRDEDGGLRRVGGWGRHLGDEGSGFAIGMAALGLVTRAADGRALPTALTETVCDAIGLNAPDELVPWIETAGKREVAALAPVVAVEADDGDAGADEIVQAAVDALVAHVRAASAVPSTPVMLWGGLVAEGGPLRRRTLEALVAEGFTVSSGTVDPGLGAALLARDAGNG